MTRDLAASLLSLAALASLPLASLLLSRSRPTWRPVAAGLAAVALLEAIDVVALWCGLVAPRVFAAVALPGVLAAMAWATGGACKDEGLGGVVTAGPSSALPKFPPPTAGHVDRYYLRRPCRGTQPKHWIGSLVRPRVRGSQITAGEDSHSGPIVQALLILPPFLTFALAASLAYPHLTTATYLAALTWPRRVAAALTLLAWAGAPRTPSRARTVALLLAGGQAVGLAGAWLLGEPGRDWALANMLTAFEYLAAGALMIREWRSGEAGGVRS